VQRPKSRAVCCVSSPSKKMALFPLHVLQAACLLAGNVFSMPLRTCYIRYILRLHPAPPKRRTGRLHPSPCNTGAVWGPRHLHPNPCNTGPVWGSRHLGACIQLSRNPWTQVLLLAPGGDDHLYIVYILNKYVSIRVQELYFALFQAVNRQEGLTILQPALPDQDFGCSSWERHLNLFCENSRDVALCYVPTIPGYRRLTICRRSNLFQKKCTGAKKHRMWEQPFRGPGRAALPPVQK